MEKKEKFLTVRVPLEVLEEMRRLSKQHTRSLNGEVLVALKEYLAKYQPERKGEDKG
jgi:hypothetical protein